jgi:hypothetical protein
MAIELIVAAETVSAEFATGFTTETVLRPSAFSLLGMFKREWGGW